jgi:hypothetical protein
MGAGGGGGGGGAAIGGGGGGAGAGAHPARSAAGIIRATNAALRNRLRPTIFSMSNIDFLHS